MKVLPHVMRNINEFNIPARNSHGYEILYFGVNLILMLNYSLTRMKTVMRSGLEWIYSSTVKFPNNCCLVRIFAMSFQSIMHTTY
jgi:hypothetical protein